MAGRCWNTTTYADGSYSLTAKATDNAGHEHEHPGQRDGGYTAPTVSITSPANGELLSGTVQITATASDTNGVKQVEFFVDGTSIGVGTNGADGWSVNWNTTTYADGSQPDGQSHR